MPPVGSRVAWPSVVAQRSWVPQKMRHWAQQQGQHWAWPGSSLLPGHSAVADVPWTVGRRQLGLLQTAPKWKGAA